MSAIVRLGRWQDTLPGTYDPERTVVVTDPPFGLRGVGASRSGDGYEVDRGFDDERSWADHVAEVLTLLPAHRHVIRGAAPTFVSDIPRPRRLCVEVARFRNTVYRPGVVDYGWQGWAVYGSLRVVNTTKRMPKDIHLIDSRDDPHNPSSGGHRGMTPYQAALWIVETWVPPGWLVLDPFAGTGTIGRAAVELGRDYLGAEIEPRWHAEAQRGLGVTPLRLDLGA